MSLVDLFLTDSESLGSQWWKVDGNKERERDGERECLRMYWGNNSVEGVLVDMVGQKLT